MVRLFIVGIILIGASFTVASCGQRIAVEYPEDYIQDSTEF